MKLVIQSQTERLSSVREFISEAARRHGFDEETVNKIALAVDEACTNVIKHAYKYATDKNIEIRISTNKSSFEVTISDDGIAFSAEAIPTPDMGQYLREYRRGGLGMYLMRSLMDKVEYTARPGKRNEVRLIKFLPARRTASS